MRRQYKNRLNKYLRHDYFDNINTQEKAYWLGFIVGDGCLYKTSNGSAVIQIMLQKRDGSHLEKFAKALHWPHPVYYYRNTSRLCVTSPHMYESLVKLGVTPRKTFSIKFPRVAKNLEIHVLRGIFDADGCITEDRIKRKPGFSLAGTKHILMASKRILGLNNKICRHTTIFQISCGGRNVIYEIYKKLYRNAKISLDRKLEKFEALYAGNE